MSRYFLYHGQLAKEIQIPPLALHPGQEAIFSDRARYRVIAADRRFGKTLLVIEWLALEPGGALDGQPVASGCAFWSALPHPYCWGKFSTRPASSPPWSMSHRLDAGRHWPRGRHKLQPPPEDAPAPQIQAGKRAAMVA